MINYHDYLTRCADLTDPNKVQQVLTYVNQIIDHQHVIDRENDEIDKIKQRIDELLPEQTSTESEKPTDPNVKMVTRLLTGMNVGDHFYGETNVRRLPFEPHTGDLVREKQYYPNSHGGYLELVSTVDKINDHIQVYHQVIVEYEETLHRYIIKRYANGERITHNGVPLTIIINNQSSQEHITDGDIVDYAFYVDKQHPFDSSVNRGHIRWVYDTTLNQSQPTVAHRISQYNRSKSTSTDDVLTSCKPKLKMDLTNKKILLASGYIDAQKIADRLMKCYQTQIDVVDPQSVKTPKDSDYQNTLDQYDAIVLATDYMHHSYSQNVIPYLREQHIPFAVANQTSNTTVERAIYRAIHNLSAYESNNQNDCNYKYE